MRPVGRIVFRFLVRRNPLLPGYVTKPLIPKKGKNAECDCACLLNGCPCEGVLSTSRLEEFENLFVFCPDEGCAREFAFLLSGASFEILLKRPRLVGRQICSDSHMPENRTPLGRCELAGVARHMTTVAIHRP